MDLHSSLRCLLIFLQIPGIFPGLIKGNCTDYEFQFETVFSVPGDVAMLNSTLVTSSVFNHTFDPYNITWYHSTTGQEIRSESGRILVRGETLWFLNLTLEDSGEYVSILRTSTWCYKQAIKLVVELPDPGKCERPQKALQPLMNRVTGKLSCPLKDYIDKLDSYNIPSSLKWYRDCDLIEDGVGKYTYMDRTKLKIDEVDTDYDNANYTCTVTFTLGGVTGSVSETINVFVSEEYYLTPQVHEPAGEIVKAEIGSSFTKKCRVFVPCVGEPNVYVSWLTTQGLILNTNPSDRIYTSKRSQVQENPIEGRWLEQHLIFSKLEEEDFYKNYTCQTHSSRGNPKGYFTLLPTDPDIILPISVLAGGVTLLFIICVIIYTLFKVDIVLCFRRAFPVFYTNTDLDGKLYDAYVAYPSTCDIGYNKDVETFAIQTLPQVLEKACAYKLFIAGRDCQPGQAIVDSVEENIQASRRLLLVYNASTFCNKKCTSRTYSNNNNISKDSNGSDIMESMLGEHSSRGSISFDGTEEISQDPRQKLEVVFATHRALLEGSLKVILVELEEISPAQLALFPESVRHLRKKQGAVCWWKNQRQRQRWRMCLREAQDEEKCEENKQRLSPSLSPSSRFWKEMRYRMPVRGKRAVYPEETALLNLK